MDANPDWKVIKEEGRDFADSPGYKSACQAASSKKPTLDLRTLANAVKAANWASKNIPGANADQILQICLFAFTKGSSVVLGGSRVRDHFQKDSKYRQDSDIDVGYGGLSEDDAHTCNEMYNRVSGGPKDSWLPVEQFVIVPGKQSKEISKMASPEDFFHRTGVRPMTDPLHAGEQIIPSGCVTFTPDGNIVEMPPGMSSEEAHSKAASMQGHKSG